MGLQIYGNIDAGSLASGKVQSITNLGATGIRPLVAGDSLQMEVFLTSQTGLVNIQDYTVRIGIGDINARPTGGTFDLGSTTGIAYNANATALQTAIAAEAAANTTTQLSPFVFKTEFTSTGAQTIPTIDSTGLTPASTVSIVKLVTGDGSTKEQWLIRIFRNPLTFQDTFQNITKTGVGEGVSGVLGLGTTEIYDQFSETVSSFTSTMEMEITDTDGNTITIFQIPVTIGGEVLGAGITASTVSPSNFLTASDVNTLINNATTRDGQVFVSASRGNDGTASRNSTTNPFATFTAAVAAAQSGDIVHMLDGYFGGEATQNITFNEFTIVAENYTTAPRINFTGSIMRCVGLGSLQTIGADTVSEPFGIKMSNGNGILVMDNLYQTKMILGATNVCKVTNTEFSSEISLTGTGTAARKDFKGCRFFGGAAGDPNFLFDETSSTIVFDNCIFDKYQYTIGTTSNININNSTQAPTGLFFKDCLFLTDSSQTPISKSSSSTTVSLDFVGGITGFAYFSNPSDFTIRGNYICQTTINDCPVQIRQ